MNCTPTEYPESQEEKLTLTLQEAIEAIHSNYPPGQQWRDRRG